MSSSHQVLAIVALLSVALCSASPKSPKGRPAGNARRSNGSSLSSCPAFGEWKESKTCVMPSDLQSTVDQQCPTEGSTRGGRKNKLLPWDMMIPSITMIFGSGTFGPGQGPPARDEPFRRPCPGSRPSKPQLDEPASAPANASNPLEVAWSNIYTKCGSCGVQVRCRTRKPTFACSPSIEVERAPCNEAEGRPACQLAPETCKVIMPNWDSPASDDASSKRRRGAKKTSAAKKTSKTNKKARKTNKKTTAKRSNRWLKVCQWENLVNGKRNASEPSKGKGRDASAPNKGKGRKSMEVTPLPGFNCAKSNKGCVCCCEPFVPVNGICQMAGESEVADSPAQEDQPVVGEDASTTLAATTGTPAFEIAHHGHPTTASESHHSEVPETTQAPEKPAQEEQKPEAEQKPDQPEEAASSSSSDNQEAQQQPAQEEQQAEESSSADAETEESKKRRRTEKQRSELPKESTSGGKPGSMTVVSQTSVTINKKQQQKMKQGQQQQQYQKP